MKIRFVVPMVALLAVYGPVAFAQTPDAQKVPTTEQMDQRFQQMSTMMNEAQNAHGAQLTELMRKHMQLMQEQMQAMHSMMGGSGMMGGMSGPGMMGGSGSTGIDASKNMLAQMQARMDLMQRMMEQMLGQQKMMMQSPPGK